MKQRGGESSVIKVIKITVQEQQEQGNNAQLRVNRVYRVHCYFHSFRRRYRTVQKEMQKPVSK